MNYWDSVSLLVLAAINAMGPSGSPMLFSGHVRGGAIPRMQAAASDQPNTLVGPEAAGLVGPWAATYRCRNGVQHSQTVTIIQTHSTIDVKASSDVYAAHVQSGDCAFASWKSKTVTAFSRLPYRTSGSEFWIETEGYIGSDASIAVETVDRIVIHGRHEVRLVRKDDEAARKAALVQSKRMEEGEERERQAARASAERIAEAEKATAAKAKVEADERPREEARTTADGATASSSGASNHISLFGVTLGWPLPVPKCTNFETYSKQPANMPCWTVFNDDDGFGGLSQLASGSEIPSYSGRIYLPIGQLPEWVVKLDCPPTLTNIVGCTGSNYIEFMAKDGVPTAFKIKVFETSTFVKAMTTKYGSPGAPPTKVRFSNDRGSSYDGTNMIWSLADAYVEFILDQNQGDIREHDGQLRGVLWVQSTDYHQARQEKIRRAAAAQKARELTP